MVRTYLQVSGSHLIIGLEGKKQAIIDEFHSYQTFDAAAAPHFVSDRFLYFWTGYEALLEAVKRKLEARTYNETGIEFHGVNFQLILEGWAELLIEKIPRLHFLQNTPFIEEFELNYEKQNPATCE